MSTATAYVPIDLPSAPTRYTDPRAQSCGSATSTPFGGGEIPVPVESITEDLLGLQIAEAELGECSGMLIPSERVIVVNAAEATSGDIPTRRRRFTIANEVGHWICHTQQDIGEAHTSPCRSRDLSRDADCDLEREAWAAAPDAREVAAHFEVSALAAQCRLYSFRSAERPA